MFRVSLLFALGSLLISCEFEPTDVKFTELRPPTLEGTSFEVKDHEQGDTIVVYKITLVKYTVDVGDNKFVSVVARMADLEFQGSNEGVYLDPKTALGYFPLKLTLTMTSRYGSLGSTVNSDLITAERNYVAHIVSEPPAARVGKEDPSTTNQHP